MKKKKGFDISDKWTVTDFGKFKEGRMLSYYGRIADCPKCKRRGAVRIWSKKELTKKRYPEKGTGRTIHKVETDGFLGIPVDECTF